MSRDRHSRETGNPERINPGSPGLAFGSPEDDGSLEKTTRITFRPLLLTLALLVTGCASSGYHPPRQGQSAAGAETYAVAKGDTLYGIARKTGIDAMRIAQANHLSPPYTIFVGQELQLPGHGGETAPAAPAAQEEPPLSPVAPPRGVTSQPLESAPPGRVDNSSPTALAPPPEPPPQPEQVASAGDFLWPVRGEIVSGFGPKPGGLLNDGINIAAHEGTPVKAAASGTVAYAGDQLKGFGNLVLIRHPDDWVTAYAHLAAIAVKKGQAVKMGQVIGTVGETGTIDSPQLHFELRHGKEAVDPATHLGEGKS